PAPACENPTTSRNGQAGCRGGRASSTGRSNPSAEAQGARLAAGALGSYAFGSARALSTALAGPGADVRDRPVQEAGGRGRPVQEAAGRGRPVRPWAGPAGSGAGVVVSGGRPPRPPRRPGAGSARPPAGAVPSRT